MLTEQEFFAQREERLRILKNCGVYVIRNLVNDNIYIGSSVNIKKRFCQHRDGLRKNKHHNKHLQRSWNKYGEENFEFVVIEHHSYPEKILGRENKCILLYNPEYNSVRVNKEGRFVLSEETKKKIGDSNRGTKNAMFGRFGKLNPASKRVIDTSTNRVFESVREAEVFYNIKKNVLAAKLNGRAKNNTTLKYL